MKWPVSINVGMTFSLRWTSVKGVFSNLIIPNNMDTMSLTLLFRSKAINVSEHSGHDLLRFQHKWGS